MLAAFALGDASHQASAQYGITDSQPASAVMGSRGGDSFQSSGGVAGPWWSGSSTVAAPPATDGGFWFGFPGLGFGGSQGSTRGMNTFTPSVTSVNGGSGFMSSSRLVPFVSGVVPVVGSGVYDMPVTTAAVLPPTPMVRSSMPPAQAMPGALPRLMTVPSGPMAPSTPGARERAKQLLMSGDTRLVAATDHVAAAKESLAEYRAAMRFVNDDADIEIRQALVYQALGKRREADKAIGRAEKIDGRLTRPLAPVPDSAGGFLAGPPPGLPVIAARGFAILDEIASLVPATESSTRPGALAWLAEAWAHRWGTTDTAAMLVAP